MTEIPKETMDVVLDALDIRGVLEFIDYRTDTIQESDRVVRCFCPVHKEQVFRTLSIDADANMAKCSYNPCPAHRQVNLVQLVALARGIEVSEAVIELVTHFGLNVDVPGAEELAEKRKEEAKEALESGDAESAYDRFKALVEKEPENAEALEGLIEACTQAGNEAEREDLVKRLAQIRMGNGEFEEAARLFESVMTEAVSDVEARMRYAECLYNLQRLDEMATEMTKVAEFYDSQGQGDHALEIHKRIAQLHPEAAEAKQEELTERLVEAGRGEEAVEELEAKATRLEQSGEPEDLLATYRQILLIDPAREDIRKKYLDTVLSMDALDDQMMTECLGIIDMYLERDQVLLAMKSLEELRKRFPERGAVLKRIHDLYREQGLDNEADELAFGLAETHLGNQEFDQAMEWAARLAQRGGALLPKALTLQSRIANKRGDPDQAVGFLVELIDHQEKKGRIDEALAVYDAVFGIQPDNLDLHRRRLAKLAELDRMEDFIACGQDLLPRLEETLQTDLALEITELLTEKAEMNTDFLMAKASVLTRLNRDDEARESLLRASEILAERDEHQQAIEILQHLLDFDPHDLQAIERLADYRLHIGLRSEALEAYQSLARLYEENANYDAQLDVLLKISEVDESDTRVLEQILEIYDKLDHARDARELRERIVRLYTSRGEYERALGIAREMLESDPNDLGALELCVQIHDSANDEEALLRDGLQLLEAHQAVGDIEKAEQVLGLLESRFPEAPEVLTHRVEALAREAQWDQALEVLDRLLELNAERGAAEESLARVRSLLGHADSPVSQLFPIWMDLCKTCNAVEENWEHTERFIDHLAQQDQGSTVVELLREAIAESPDFDPLRRRYILLLQSLGLKRKAVEALLDWARRCGEAGNIQGAVQHYEEALELEPDDVDLMTEVVRFRSRHHLESGLADLAIRLAEQLENEGLIAQAVSILDDVLSALPARDDLRDRVLELEEIIATPEALRDRYVQTARAQVEQERYDEARTTLTEGIGRFPMDLALRRQMLEVLEKAELESDVLAELANIATIQAEREEYVEAIQTLDTLLQRAPDNVRAQAMRAEFHARLGESEKALEEFRNLSKSIERMPVAEAGDMIAAGGDAAPGELINMLPIMPEYNFDNFIVGERNNFAYSTALSIARNPGTEYNPLFLHGDVGLGKTHLLQAIANHLAGEADQRVIYTSSEEFSNALVDAIQNNTVKQFRALYKSADVLLIDDVHYLAQKERAQEEFFQIFNTLYQANHQIVLTSDRPPKEIAHLEKRLRSRFGAGIIIEIQAPDVETRTAILRRVVGEAGVELDDDAINRIAQRVETNVRALKSVLNQLAARAKHDPNSLTDSLIDEVIEQVSE